jgi:hypothetical protein
MKILTRCNPILKTPNFVRMVESRKLELVNIMEGTGRRKSADTILVGEIKRIRSRWIFSPVCGCVSLCVSVCVNC